MIELVVSEFILILGTCRLPVSALTERCMGWFCRVAMAGVFEYEWLQKDCDVKRCMKVGKECDIVIASLLPQFFTKVDRLEGDGGVGTVRLSYLNPGMSIDRISQCIVAKPLLAVALSRIPAQELLCNH